MLDDDKRAIGKASQNQPAKVGRIKQKAMELGMSTEEFILRADDLLSKQADTTSSNREVDNLKSEIAELKEMLRTPQPQPQQQGQLADQVNMFSQMVAALTAIMPKQESLSETMRALAELDKLRGGYVEQLEEEEESLQDKAMLKAVEAIAGKINFGNQSGAPLSQSSETVEASAVIAPAAQNKNKGVDKVITDEEAKAAADALPAEVKKGVKSGNITLEMAKTAVKKNALDNKTLPPSDKDIEKVYNYVKNDKNE